ncbi:hypothetical protein ACHAXS_011658 [Conticribra weissflogii]
MAQKSKSALTGPGQGARLQKFQYFHQVNKISISQIFYFDVLCQIRDLTSFSLQVRKPCEMSV